ncbi:uncharacterized protein LOC136095116 [Hydra vulgaris]|uniref:uncharacterized protein LOC136095116 n=1 Tax=Hydra vulgaris TaxID=6087 RepID=UPI0032EA45F8
MSMQLNIEKCKIMHVNKSNKLNKYSNKYHISDYQLSMVDCVNNLGIMFKSDLKYGHHISACVSKANKILSHIRHTFSFLNADILKLLYVSLVRPHLEYASSIWNPFFKKKQ